MPSFTAPLTSASPSSSEGIVRVFVDAAPHVPPHRRLPLLSHLLSTVGPQDYLYVALGLLVEKHVVLPTGKELVCEHTLHSDIAEQLHCNYTYKNNFECKKFSV